MLSVLRVMNLGVIGEVEMDLPGGLIALTGETGAGKTMIVSAIELLLGSKAIPEMIREGEESAEVTGLFSDGVSELVLRREINRSGRSKAYIDGKLVSAAEISEVCQNMVELFSQNLSTSLSKAQTQLELVDSFGSIDTRELKRLLLAERETSARIDELIQTESLRLQRLDLLGFQIDEIGRLLPIEPDEDDRLEAEIAILSRVDEIRRAASMGLEAISTDRGNGSGRDLIAGSLHWLSADGTFSKMVDRIRSVVVELDDIASELGEFLDGLDEDPERLDYLRRRLVVINEAKRKYGPTLSEVLGHHEKATLEFEELNNFDASRDSLLSRLAEIREALAKEQSLVRSARAESASAVSIKVEEYLRELRLANARFRVDLSSAPDGSPVNFLFSANPGMALQLLSKVASGGEMSRVMLSVCLVAARLAATMVFDEIDAGIGGETALHVGRALSRLSKDRQVIVVTHLPQVAAFADFQYVVEKELGSGRADTSVRPVVSSERISEIARMLSGQSTSEAALRHASELLELARVTRKAT